MLDSIDRAASETDKAELQRLEDALRHSEARLERESERLMALHHASTVLAMGTGEPDTVFREVLRSAVGLLGASSGTLYRWDDDAKLLRCVHKWRVPASDPTPDLKAGEGLAGQTFARGQPIIVNDYPAWEFAMTIGIQGGLRAGLGVPLRHAGQCIGALLIRSYRDDGRRFTEEDARLVELFGDQAAIAMENARAFQQEQQRRRQLEAIRDVTSEITRELDLTALLRLIIRRAADLVGAASGVVYLWDESDEVLVPRAWHKYTWVQYLRFRLGEGIAGTAAQRRGFCITNDYRTSPHAHPAVLQHTEIRAVLAAATCTRIASSGR